MKLEELKKHAEKVISTTGQRKLESQYFIGYETKFDVNETARDRLKEYKENSLDWSMQYFDEMMISTIIENANLGYSRKELIFNSKNKLDVDKTLANLEELGYITIFHNPKKYKIEQQKKLLKEQKKIELKEIEKQKEIKRQAKPKKEKKTSNNQPKK